MSIGFVRALIAISTAALLSACGSSKSSSPSPIPVITQPPVIFKVGEHTEHCANGGDFVVSFADANRNGVKDKGENESTTYYCAGKLAFKEDYSAMIEVSEAPQTLEPLVERTLTLSFTLSKRPQAKISFDYAFLAGTATKGEDFVGTDGSIVFERGETKKSISVTIKHDTQKENHETFTIGISNQVNTDLSNITVRINDDDNPKIGFTQAQSVLIESSSNINTGSFVVKLSEAQATDISVPFILKSDKVSDAFEVPENGVDYNLTIQAGSSFPLGANEKCNANDALEPLAANKGCLVFKAGETEKTIEIATIDDNLAEGREKLDIQLYLVDGLSAGDHVNHILSIADAASLIQANHRHTCALSEDASLKCWGYNIRGQLGINTILPVGSIIGTMKGNGPLVNFTTKDKVTGLALGFLHTCALLQSNTVKCWGYNASGQLGYDNAQNIGDQIANENNTDLLVSDALKAIELDGSVAAITAGASHTCALLTDGAVKCWGENQFGQLGLGDTANRGDGLIANPNYNKKASSADDPKGSDGKVIECQVVSKPLYQLTCEDKSTEMGKQLAKVDLSLDKSGVKQLMSGANHNCVLFNSGKVTCWGQNQYGQLGLGNNTDAKSNIGDSANEMGEKLAFVDLGANKTAKSIGLGDRHTCALLNDNSVKCWGNNSFGQLGQGNTTVLGDKANQMGDSLTAIALGANFNATELRVGGFHSCAVGTVNSVADEKKVKCWGRNRYGQLGYEDTNNRGDNADEMADKLGVLAFPPERSVKELALGRNHSCAILDNDQVKCWGISDSGQLGLENFESISDGLVINPKYDSSKKAEDDHPDGDCQSANRRIPVTCDSVKAELGDPDLITEAF